MTILVATSNPHKLEEILAVFEAEATVDAAPPELCTLADLQRSIPEPVEDGDTFEANALKKARHYAAASEMLCLADDSGLEVDALNGEPGVLSARYAGATGPRAEVDLANNTLLLERLRGVEPQKRTARFVCAMALVTPPASSGIRKWLPPQILHHPMPPHKEGAVFALLRGTVEGRIILPEEAAEPAYPERGRGTNGFGYDPLFLVPSLGRTTAELTPQHKNAISHRGDAARKMFAELRRLGLTAPTPTPRP